MDNFADFRLTQDVNWNPEISLSEFLHNFPEEEISNQCDEEKSIGSDKSNCTVDSVSTYPQSLEHQTSILNPPEQRTDENTTSLSPEEDTNPEHKTPTSKRKRKVEETPFCLITEIFLRIFYPISTCMNKNIIVGISKDLNFKPAVLLNHGTKSIVFDVISWESFIKYEHLVQCYILNKVYGKKTCINLANSDIEIETSKMRGEYLIKFKNTSKHDTKVLLTINEFKMLSHTVPAINRYIEQLKLSEDMYKNYLTETVETKMDPAIVYGPVETSIYNRLPQEVYLYHHMKYLSQINQTEGNDNQQNSMCFLIGNSFGTNTNNEKLND